MKRIILIKLLLMSTLISCQKNKIEEKIIISPQKSNTIMEEILRKQIQYGYLIKENGMDGINDYPYGSEDLEINQNLSVEILKNHGYNFPSTDEFNKKIEEIFSFKSNKGLINFLIEYPCAKEKEVYQIDGNYIVSNNNPLFIDRNKKILTEALFIPELIDYKKKYPNIAKEEENLPSERKNNKSTPLKIIKWKDVSELDHLRFNNVQLLVNRNKFLFNNNKASFAWLQFHDKPFLESLVKTFGYTKDRDLLLYVFKNNYKNTNELQKILSTEKCGGEITLNKEVMEIIAESDTESQIKYLNAILNYLILAVKSKDSPLNKNKSKKAEILGKIAYLSTKIGDKHNMYYDFFSILGSDEGGKSYDDEFKKNNYYDIPDFRQIWEETKDGGVWYFPAE